MGIKNKILDIYNKYTKPSKKQISMINDFIKEFEIYSENEQDDKLLKVINTILLKSYVLLKVKNRKEFAAVYLHLITHVGKYYSMRMKGKTTKSRG